MKWWEMTVGLWVKQLWVRSDGASCSHRRHFFLVQRLRLASLMNSGNNCRIDKMSWLIYYWIITKATRMLSSIGQ